jgi:hypothetical protein
MTAKFKFLLAGLMVAAALVTTNVSFGTPSASAQSPYCQVNPGVCTPAFCNQYPQLCNQPITPIYPVYPINNCGIYGCVTPYTYNCAPVPYSPIYGYNYRPPCTYPLAYNNICGIGYAYQCNAPYLAGAPARVNVAVSPAIATCGSTPITVQANITDGFGVPVANGTSVSFSSTIGGSASATTIGGNATGVINIPAGSASGVATIRVTAGGASATTSVQVNCAPVVQQQVVVVTQRPSGGQVVYRPGPQMHQPQQPVIIQRGPAPQPRGPQGPYIPPFAPPRTGEAGLTDAILAPNDDSAANQALIDAYREYEYGVLDASQYDWAVIPDDSDASIQLASDLMDAAYGVIDAAQVDVVVEAGDSAATTSLVIDVLSNPTEYGNA